MKQTRSELALLLNREWQQYRSVNNRSLLLIWAVYLLMFVVMDGMVFMIIYLPILMGYAALLGMKQSGEPVRQATEDFLLPVPLEDVIRARYLFVFAVTLVSSAAAALVVLLARVLDGSTASPVMVLGFSLSIAGIITLISAPLLYRRGAARSRIYMILVITLGAMVGGGAAVVSQTALTGAGIAALADFAYLLAAAVIWALTPLSARLTVKMYRRGGVDHEKRPILHP